MFLTYLYPINVLLFTIIIISITDYFKFFFSLPLLHSLTPSIPSLLYATPPLCISIPAASIFPLPFLRAISLSSLSKASCILFFQAPCYSPTLANLIILYVLFFLYSSSSQLFGASDFLVTSFSLVNTLTQVLFIFIVETHFMKQIFS